MLRYTVRHNRTPLPGGTTTLVLLGVLQAFVVGWVLHLLHLGSQAGHEMDPTMHWLRDSVLAVPVSVIALCLGASLARRLRDAAGLGALTAQLALALLGSAAYAIMSVPANELHARLFPAPHPEAMGWLAHASRDVGVVLGTSLGLLLLLAVGHTLASRALARRARPSTRLIHRALSALSAVAMLAAAVAPAQLIAPAPASAVTTAAPVRCTGATAARGYDVAAVNVKIPYNRWGDLDPHGQMFVLQGDKAAVKNWHVPLKPDPAADPARNRRLRPRPLVLRANAGECVRVTLTNELNDTQMGDLLVSPRASMKIMGATYDAQTSDGSAVGFNEDTTVPNRDNPATSEQENKISYYWLAPEREGIYLFRDEAALSGGQADGGSIAHGLYGALAVEPAGSTWSDPVSGAPLYTGTTHQSGELYLNAMITPARSREELPRDGADLSGRDTAARQHRLDLRL